MKRLVALVCLLTLSVGSLSGGSVLAFNPFQNACEGTGSTSVACQKNTSTCDDPITGRCGEGILIKAANLLSEAVGVVAIIIIIVGGIMYIMSSGDSARVNSAKNTILFALVGLVVASLAQAIIRFVILKL